ncbi:MAG: hypothetical protein IJU25_04650, partial [Lachnospiraceae bacterium]|nr:hypothetical protein [Lachnospiraceae bacterium]
MANEKKKLSIVLALMCAGLLLAGLLIASLAYFSTQMQSVSDEAEELYFEHLYTISADLINADRDFYQSMLGAMQYHDVTAAPDDIPPEMMAELTAQYLDDYESNKQQVIDRINEAHDIAGSEPSLLTGTILNTDNYDQLYTAFMNGYNEWESVYDVKNGTGDYTLFIQDFESTRDSISEMTDITEQWAISQKELHEAKIKTSIVTSTIIFVVIILVVLAAAILILLKMRKSISYMVGAV